MASRGDGQSAEVYRLDRADTPPLSAPVDLARSPAFTIGAMRVDPATRQVVHPDDSSETLEPRVMEVFVALHRAAGAILSRDDLIAACWRGMVVGEDAIQRVIQRLRKLAAATGAFRIETITRVGYRLHPAGGHSAIPGMAEAGPARRWVAMGIAAACLLALAGAAWLGRGSAPSPVTIALEPFTAVDPAQRAQAARLTSAFRRQLAASGTPAQAGPATLAVHAEIRPGNGAPELSVRIDHTGTGATLWRKTTDLVPSDPRLDDSLVEGLAGAVACAARGVGNGPATGDAITIGMVLRYCDAANGGEPPEAGLDNGRRLAARAPGLWIAQVALADSVVRRTLYPVENEAALRREGLAAADRAIDLLPDAADSYWLKAMLTPPARPLEREALFRKAIDSRFVQCKCGLQFYGDFLLQSGRASEALAMYQRGTDPQDTHSIAPWRVFLAATIAGEEGVADGALASLEKLGKSGDFAPADDARMVRFWRDGDYHSALTLLANRSGTPSLDAQRATFAALASGDPRERATALAAIDRVPEDFVSEKTTLQLLVELGENDRAFALLERSLRRGGAFSAPGRFPGNARSLLWGNPIEPLWRDARFTDYLRRAGFLAFWRASNSRPDACKRPDPPPFCASIPVPLPGG